MRMTRRSITGGKDKKFYKREAEERRNAGYDRTKIVMQIIKSNEEENVMKKWK